MQDVNIGIAVSVDAGLMVPVIRGADQKSIEASNVVDFDSFLASYLLLPENP